MAASKVCINIDWLSVYCIEPKGKTLDAAYFSNLGWDVKSQPYGTSIYKEKIYLYQGKDVFLEIERNPYSLKKNGGIFEDGACHIRLSNKTCYQYNAAILLMKFIEKYEYEYRGVSRVDVCCDFTSFDNGMNPQNFVNKYMEDKIWKVHQSALSAYSSGGDDTQRFRQATNLSAHGKETVRGRVWNSLKWGAMTSPLSTKIYDKTLELANNSQKYYIKDAWVQAGIADMQVCSYIYTDPKTKESQIRKKRIAVMQGSSVPETIPIEETHPVNVWRVEFSIKTEGRNWVDIGDGHKVKIDLRTFSNADIIASVFFACKDWMFSFVKAEYVNGSKQRTNRCQPLNLFSSSRIKGNYKPKRMTTKTDPSRTERLIANKLMQRLEFGNLPAKIAKSYADVLLDLFQKNDEWLIPDPDNKSIKVTFRQLREERTRYEEKAKILNAEPNEWISLQKDSDSYETLNKNSNRWKRYRQQKILEEKQKMDMYTHLYLKQVERYKEVLGWEPDLPNSVLEIIHKPF